MVDRTTTVGRQPGHGPLNSYMCTNQVKMDGVFTPGCDEQSSGTPAFQVLYKCSKSLIYIHEPVCFLYVFLV